MNQTRTSKERDDLVHLLRQVDRIEIRNVMEKVVMTEVSKAHQNILVKVRQEKANKPSCKNFKKESCQKGISRNYWHFLNVQISKLQPDASSETSAFTHTKLDLLMTRTFQPLLHFASDERQMQLRNVQSEDKTQFQLSNIISRTDMFSKGKTWDLHRVTQTGSKNQRNPNVPAFWGLTRKLAWTLHRTRQLIPSPWRSSTGDLTT